MTHVRVAFACNICGTILPNNQSHLSACSLECREKAKGKIPLRRNKSEEKVVGVANIYFSPKYDLFVLESSFATHILSMFECAHAQIFGIRKIRNITTLMMTITIDDAKNCKIFRDIQQMSMNQEGAH